MSNIEFCIKGIIFRGEGHVFISHCHKWEVEEF